MATASIADLRTNHGARSAEERAQKEKEEYRALKPRDQIAYVLEKRRDELAKLIPKHLSIERVLKVAQVAVSDSPGLLACAVPTLVRAIGVCIQLGLEPNTPLGHSYLIPFNRRKKEGGKWVSVPSVQLIIGYKGFVVLADRAGIALSAYAVYANDTFVLRYGLDEELTHKPLLLPSRARGALLGFYAVARDVKTRAARVFEFMHLEDVYDIRNSTPDFVRVAKEAKEANREVDYAAALPKSPWIAHEVQMGRKTLIRRVVNYLPMSIELALAARIDGLGESGKGQTFEADDDGFHIVDDDDDGYVGEDGGAGADARGSAGSGAQTATTNASLEDQRGEGLQIPTEVRDGQYQEVQERTGAKDAATTSTAGLFGSVE